jgi:hypothetical protein
MAGINYVFAISRVAEMLGEDEEWLDESASLASITSPSSSKSIKPIPIY